MVTVIYCGQGRRFDFSFDRYSTSQKFDWYCTAIVNASMCQRKSNILFKTACSNWEACTLHASVHITALVDMLYKKRTSLVSTVATCL